MTFQISVEDLAFLLLVMGKTRVRATLQYILLHAIDEFADLLLEKLPVFESSIEQLVANVAVS